MNEVLTVGDGVSVPHSFNNNSEKDETRKISTLEHKGFSYHALRDLVQRTAPVARAKPLTNIPTTCASMQHE